VFFPKDVLIIAELVFQFAYTLEQRLTVGLEVLFYCDLGGVVSVIEQRIIGQVFRLAFEGLDMIGYLGDRADLELQLSLFSVSVALPMRATGIALLPPTKRKTTLDQVTQVTMGEFYLENTPAAAGECQSLKVMVDQGSRQFHVI
tara:strand:- start:155 stop:589 length:435 start_codon:yes stop_codon:yes gene_type:complete